MFNNCQKSQKYYGWYLKIKMCCINWNWSWCYKTCTNSTAIYIVSFYKVMRRNYNVLEEFSFFLLWGEGGIISYYIINKLEATFGAIILQFYNFQQI